MNAAASAASLGEAAFSFVSRRRAGREPSRENENASARPPPLAPSRNRRSSRGRAIRRRFVGSSAAAFMFAARERERELVADASARSAFASAAAANAAKAAAASLAARLVGAEADRARSFAARMMRASSSSVEWGSDGEDRRVPPFEERPSPSPASRLRRREGVGAPRSAVSTAPPPAAKRGGSRLSRFASARASRARRARTVRSRASIRSASRAASATRVRSASRRRLAASR